MEPFWSNIPCLCNKTRKPYIYLAGNCNGRCILVTRHIIERVMSVLLILCFLLLSWQAARADGEKKNEEKNYRTVLVDPGHGGKDPGMVGAGGLEEKGINLDISLKLKKRLEGKGFHVVLTRETDEGLYDEQAENKKLQDLKRRIRLIEEESPDLVVSIHQNSYHEETVRGAQVFYYTDSAQSERAAELIQAAFREADPGNTKKAKGNSTYYILKKTEVPVVIAECGFLSNREEAVKLADEEYQQEMAEAAAKGVMRYLEGE